jgi:hypothetical protein
MLTNLFVLVKHQILMRKMVADETIPFEQRLQHITDYLKSLYTRERLKKNIFN